MIAGIYRTTIIVLIPQGVATAKALIKIQNCQTRRAAVQRLVPANNIRKYPTFIKYGFNIFIPLPLIFQFRITVLNHTQFAQLGNKKRPPKMGRR